MIDEQGLNFNVRKEPLFCLQAIIIIGKQNGEKN